MLEAVLFDMDGTLVSTEETWLEVEHEVMDRLGGPWGPEHQAALVGGALDASARYMLDLSGSDVAPGVVKEWLIGTMVRRLTAGPVHWMPGAQELLLAVREAGVPTALVSQSPRPLMDAVLAALGTAPSDGTAQSDGTAPSDSTLFDATVAGDEVSRPKPDPEPYQMAARRLDVEPARCVVLEDSVNGAAAGVAAGCPTVAIPSVTAIPDAPGLTVVRSLAELDLGRLRCLVADAR